MDIKINKTWLNFSENNPIEQPEIEKNEKKIESKFNINFDNHYDELMSKEIKLQKKLDYINIDDLIQNKEIKKTEKKEKKKIFNFKNNNNNNTISSYAQYILPISIGLFLFLST